MIKKSNSVNFLFFILKAVLKKIPHLIFYFLIGLPEIVLAQKEGNNWYFGGNAGITFDSGKPAALINGQLFTYEGCATISNSKGRLLFYTDGLSVLDSTHTLTPNGIGLKGNYSSTQSAIIVPRPDSVGSYYIFTVDELGGANGLCYSEFKMSLNSGKGDVVSSKKNSQLIKSSCEKITAVKHANGRDYWVLAHHFGTDTIYSFLITPAGISSKVVKSNTGLKIPKADIQSTLGYLKISPNGSKIAYATYTLDSLALGDFNSTTGVVSNVMVTYLKIGYGIEFSPGSKYLYATEFTRPNVVMQFNANPTSRYAFKASKVILDTTSNDFALQLGPDGKIYSTEFSGQYLNVIHAPDSAGKACRYEKNNVYLGGKLSYYGLPAFIPSIFMKNDMHYTRNCLNDSTFVWPYVTNEPDSVKLDFGDSASGPVNYSKSITKAYHIYKKTGVYEVKLIAYYKNNNDTTRIYIPIKNQKPFIGNDTIIPCNAFSTILKPQKNYLKYKWSNGDTLKTSAVKTKGTYILMATDSLKCSASDTIIIENPIISASFSITDTTVCKNYNSFRFKNKSIFTNDSLKSILWKLSDNTSYTDSVFIKSFNTADSFNIKLIVSYVNGCKDSMSKNVVVHPNTEIGFSINKSIQCYNGHDFSFQDTSKILLGNISSYKWNLGDGDTAITRNITTKKYSNDTTYKVSLITTTDRGCKDTLSKNIELFPNPKAGFTINQTTQCFRWNSFDYTNASVIGKGSITSYNWTLGDGDSRNSKDVIAKHYSSIDSFQVDLVLVSDNGCRDSISKWVRIIEMNSEFDISVDSTSCPVFTFSNTGTNNKRIKWNLGDPGLNEEKNTRFDKEFNHQFSQLGTFTTCLFTENVNGCLDTLCKTVTVNIAKKLKIPNVFTPGNNDKLNDAFDIETKGIEYYNLEIYNRWGQKIYQTDVDGIGDDGHNWRGRPNVTSNLYPDGTYFYILNYRFKCEDTEKEAHGIITLIGETD